ncbi:MFS transporter [Jiangella mangrovi]|uniref:MFS family permease n=1 Tax=Jiangella mangrovi TaxID=1524084 RepID=A0A7W9GUN1_9ACTN|nr:MFS transporter [Jiangella mangrovi]MBB5790267.1 MFS family permease [Jiangella mangrovi]
MTTTTHGTSFWDRIGPYSGARNKLALGMFAVLLLSYVLNAMDRQLFSILAPDARDELGLTVPEIGLATTIFTLGMGLAALPTGFLLARLKRRSVVLVGLVIFSAAIVLTAFAQGLADLLVYRFVLGIGESMQLTALLAIGTTYFLNHRGIAASSLNFTFGIGAIIGPNLGAVILSAHGWKVPLVSFGLAGIPVFILIVALVRSWFTEYDAADDGGRAAVRPADVPVDPVTHAAEPGASSLLDRGPVLLAVATAFAGLAIYGYLGLYPTYLREQLGFSPEDAGFAVSLYGLGAVLSLVGGWLGDRYDFRIVLAVSLVVSAVSGYLLFTEISSLAAHAALSFVFGGAISGMVYANLSAGIIKSMKRSLASRGSGLFVTALYLPAAFAGYLLGTLSDHLGWTEAALIQLSAFSIVSAVLSLAARPKVRSGDAR